MKVIDHALGVLPQSPVRIADAVKTAGDTMLEQGQSFASEVTACAQSLKTGMQTIAEQMRAIPDLLDPQPILSCCTGVLETAAADLRQLASDAAAIPQRLMAQGAAAQKVVDSAREAVESMSTLLPDLASLVPDFGARMPFFDSLPGRALALAELARRSGAMVEQYGRQLLPLSGELQQLGTLQAGPGAGSAMVQTLLARAEQLQSDAVAQVQALRDTLDGNVGDLDAVMQAATDEVTQAMAGLSELIGQKGDALLAPLQAQIDLVDGINSALDNEVHACDALFVDGCAQLDRLGDILLKPLASARVQVDAVLDQLAAAAATVDGMLAKVRQPLDGLDARVDAISEALRNVVTVIQEEVDKVIQLLDELDVDAENAKIILRALPENFVPVRTMIAQAIALLVDVKSKIPGFVAEANSALNAAGNELDQADFLCTNAIQICTRYMMKAPALMLARTLFVGIKAMMPGVKTAIASARQAAGAAGTQATGLMDQAIALVEALNPLLDQAIAQLQLAIDALLALLEQMQEAMKLVAAAAETIPPLLQEQADQACAAAHSVLDKVRAAAEQCLSQLQSEALMRRLQQELSDLLDRTFQPLEAQISAAAAPLRNVIEQGRAEVGKAAVLAQGSLRTLGQAIATARDLAAQPVQALRDVLQTAQENLDSVSGAAQQQVRLAAGQALSYVDQAADAISSLNFRAVAGQIAPFASYHDDFSATFEQVKADLQRAGDVVDVVNHWQVEATQTASDLLNRVTDTAGGALDSLSAVQRASENASSKAQGECDTMLDGESVAAQVQRSFDGMQQDAQSVSAASSGVLEEMSGALDEAKAESETVGAPDPAATEPALAQLQAQADKAIQHANDVKEAELTLAAQIAATEKDVGAAAEDATARTTALKDQAQAGIRGVLAQVEAVQARVNVARSEAIKAEAIVDAEVVKFGGTSWKANAEESGVAAAGAGAAAAAGAGATGAAGAGAAAAAGAGAAAAADAAAAVAGDSAAGGAAGNGSAAGADVTASADSAASDANASGTAAVDANAGVMVDNGAAQGAAAAGGAEGNDSAVAADAAGGAASDVNGSERAATTRDSTNEAPGSVATTRDSTNEAPGSVGTAEANADAGSTTENGAAVAVPTADTATAAGRQATQTSQADADLRNTAEAISPVNDAERLQASETEMAASDAAQALSNADGQRDLDADAVRGSDVDSLVASDANADTSAQGGGAQSTEVKDDSPTGANKTLAEVEAARVKRDIARTLAINAKAIADAEMAEAAGVLAGAAIAAPVLAAIPADATAAGGLAGDGVAMDGAAVDAAIDPTASDSAASQKGMPDTASDGAGDGAAEAGGAETDANGSAAAQAGATSVKQGVGVPGGAAGGTATGDNASQSTVPAQANPDTAARTTSDSAPVQHAMPDIAPSGASASFAGTDAAAAGAPSAGVSSDSAVGAATDASGGATAQAAAHAPANCADGGALVLQVAGGGGASQNAATDRIGAERSAVTRAGNAKAPSSNQAMQAHVDNQMVGAESTVAALRKALNAAKLAGDEVAAEALADQLARIVI